MNAPHAASRTHHTPGDAESAFVPAHIRHAVPRRRSISQAVIPMVAFILMVLAAVVWVLLHLPSAVMGTQGNGLAISNRGLPLSNARITAKLADGTSAVIDAGRLPRGLSTVPLPESVPAASIRSVVIEGDLLGVQVNSVSVLGPSLAETNPETP